VKNRCNYFIIKFYRDHQHHSKKFIFNQDKRTTRKEFGFTQFNEELKSLKSVLTKNNDEEIDTLYKKIEELL
jgi:hypothetical protein